MGNGEMTNYIQFINKMSEKEVEIYINEEIKRHALSEKEIMDLKEIIQHIRKK